MEELRSTEILDREIQDDARRKAEKILKAGEGECRLIAEEVAERIAAFRTEKEREYAGKLDAYLRDAEAAIPLEKQRKLVSFVDNAVQEALDLRFRDIGEAGRLALFAGLLERYKTVLGGARVTIIYSGYSGNGIREFAERVFGAAGISSITAAQDRSFDGLTVETEDRRILCRATLAEIRDELLSSRRQELANALFGGRLGE